MTRYPRRTSGRGTRYLKKVARRKRTPAGRRFLAVLALIAIAAVVQWRQDQPAPAPDGRSRPQPPLEAAVADRFTGRVVQVGDGDTMVLKLAEGQEVKVRFYGLDAPELDQPHGREARDFLAKLILNREVRVEKQDIDQYGRVVGQVFDSNWLINLTLVAGGHAWVYEQFCRQPICRQMKAEEAKARQKGLGLWAKKDPQPPWRWRQSQGKRSR